MKKKLKCRGLHTYRFEKMDNPEEGRFAKAWNDQNEVGSNLAYLLTEGVQEGRPLEPSKRDHVVAATVIQWLGSPVGQSFLQQLGWMTPKQTAEAEVLLKQFAGSTCSSRARTCNRCRARRLLKEMIITHD